MKPGFFVFLQDTQPAQMGKLGVFQSEQKKRRFLNRLQGELAKRGIIDVLRNGIKVYPVDLIMFYLTPTENNVKAGKMFERNIFSVTRQLRYSQDAGKLALDLCLFINGLPIITFELKNQLTKQNTDDAVQQYRDDRDPRDLLLSFNEYTIAKKVAMMVEHFHEQVIAKGKIGGQARAMVVTSSIPRCVEYYYAINKCLAERHSPYKAIIAFSGEHKYLGQRRNIRLLFMILSLGKKNKW